MLTCALRFACTLVVLLVWCCTCGAVGVNVPVSFPMLACFVPACRAQVPATAQVNLQQHVSVHASYPTAEHGSGWRV